MCNDLLPMPPWRGILKSDPLGSLFYLVPMSIIFGWAGAMVWVWVIWRVVSMLFMRVIWAVIRAVPGLPGEASLWTPWGSAEVGRCWVWGSMVS